MLVVLKRIRIVAARHRPAGTRMTIRFHLDESMPNAVAEGLRRRGFDITTSIESGLIAASDPDQLAYSLREERLLITRDQDFLRLNAQGVEHAGIVFWTERRSVGQLIRAVDAMTLDHASEELRGRVVYM
jgi:predicted nuclease of predicted toxin-antitoxin system